MQADSRPSRRSIEEREAAMPISHAADLLLGMFDLQTNRPHNIHLDELQKGYWLYKTYDERAEMEWPTKTSNYTPNSPKILTEHVENAPKILTITYIHHYLAYSPSHDIVIADIGSGAKGYWYSKFEKDHRRGAFDLISNWQPVRELLHESPRNHEFGAAICLWNRVPQQPYYQMAKDGKLELHGVSLMEALEFLAHG